MLFTPTGDLLLLFDNSELYRLKITVKDDNQRSVSTIVLVSKNVHDFDIIQNQKLCIISKTRKMEVYSLLDHISVEVEERNVNNVIGNMLEGLVLSNTSEILIIDGLGKRVDLPWKKYLRELKITTIFQGNENVIWVGTDGDGIFKLYPMRKSFNLISKAQVPEFSEGIIRAFTESPGNSFWVGTKGKGLFRFPTQFYEKITDPLEYENFYWNGWGRNRYF